MAPIPQHRPDRDVLRPGCGTGRNAAKKWRGGCLSEGRGRGAEGQGQGAVGRGKGPLDLSPACASKNMAGIV